MNFILCPVITPRTNTHNSTLEEFCILAFSSCFSDQSHTVILDQEINISGESTKWRSNPHLHPGRLYCVQELEGCFRVAKMHSNAQIRTSNFENLLEATPFWIWATTAVHTLLTPEGWSD